jgi:ATP phosphoribosyltransferase regulatory subunit
MPAARPKSRLSSAHALSSRERSLIPVGVATILPHAARQVRHLENKLLGTIGRWGYNEIILPTFEYLDVLAPGLEAELLETCYQFVDRTTGRTLLLRPDATAQVARTIAMGLTGDGLPQRLCYRTSVFRYEPEHAGRGREIFQVGAELVGVDDVVGDLEIVSALVECLRATGLESFTIALGHVGFVKGLLMRSGLSPQGQKRAEQAAARKDLPRLEEILAGEGIAKSVARAIREAPELAGREEVLERGRALAAGDPVLLAPLDRLAQLYQMLCAGGCSDSILLDLGEFRGFDYYDGVVFDVFAEGVGAELGGGGRYDHLIGRFGRQLPSTGFAIDVDRLFRAVRFPEESNDLTAIDYLVVGPRRAASRIGRVAAALRKGNLRVAQQTVRGGDDVLLEQAISAGQTQRTKMIVVVGAPGLSADDIMIGLPRPMTGEVRRNGRASSTRFNRIALSAVLKGAGLSRGRTRRAT